MWPSYPFAKVISSWVNHFGKWTYWSLHSALILFEICLFKHFSPVANFGYQSLVCDVRSQLNLDSIQNYKKELVHSFAIAIHFSSFSLWQVSFGCWSISSWQKYYKCMLSILLDLPLTRKTVWHLAVWQNWCFGQF